MKIFFLLFLFMSCSHQVPSRSQHEVSLQAAMDQAQASYLRGCVDALHDLKIPKVFESCRDKSILHREEVEEILEQ
jgi:hypothetical protein